MTQKCETREVAIVNGEDPILTFTATADVQVDSFAEANATDEPGVNNLATYIVELEESSKVDH